VDTVVLYRGGGGEPTVAIVSEALLQRHHRAEAHGQLSVQRHGSFVSGHGGDAVSGSDSCLGGLGARLEAFVAVVTEAMLRIR
jgi:hypothetical protein